MPERWATAIDAVTRRRKALGLSQRRCATLAGISATTWSDMEKGATISELTQGSVARTLGWPSDFFDRVLAGADPAELPAVTPTAARSTEQRLADLEERVLQLTELVEDALGHPAPDRGGR